MNKNKIQKLFSLLFFLLISILTLFSITQLRHLDINNTSENGDYNQTESFFDNQKEDTLFRLSPMISLVITTTDETIITAQNIAYIQQITRDIQNISHVESVQSLANIDLIQTIAGGFHVGPLIPDHFLGTPEEIDQVYTDLASWPEIYDKICISNDYRGTQIIITLDPHTTSQQQAAIDASLSQIIKENQISTLDIHIVSKSALSLLLQQLTNKNCFRIFPLALLIALFGLLIAFRRKEGLLPLLTAGISTLWTLGLMVLQGTPFSLLSSCIPFLIIALGSTYGIHLIHRYLSLVNEEPRPLSKETKYGLITQARKESWATLTLSAGISILGFLIYAITPISQLKQLALSLATGLGLSLILSLTLIPALLRLQSAPLPMANHTPKRENQSIQGFLRGTPFNKTILILLVLITLSLVTRFTYQRNASLLSLLPASSSLSIGLKKINTNFTGANSLSFVIEGAKKGDLAQPDILKSMDNLTLFLTARYPEIGKMLSITDFIKKMNSIFHSEEENTAIPLATPDQIIPSSFFALAEEPTSFFTADTTNSEENTKQSQETPKEKDFSSFNGDIDYHEIPFDVAKYPVANKAGLKNLISQYLLLYSGTLTQFIDNPIEPSVARIIVQLSTFDPHTISSLIADAQAFASQNFPAGYTLTIEGQSLTGNQNLTRFTQSVKRVVLWLFIAIFILFLLTFSSPLAACLSMIPIFLPTLITFILMGRTGLSLSLILSPFTIGITFMYCLSWIKEKQHQWYHPQESSPHSSFTISNSQKSITMSALVTSGIFISLLASSYQYFHYLGLFLIISVMTSALTVCITLPWIFNKLAPQFLNKNALFCKGKDN